MERSGEEGGRGEGEREVAVGKQLSVKLGRDTDLVSSCVIVAKVVAHLLGFFSV